MYRKKRKRFQDDAAHDFWAAVGRKEAKQLKLRDMRRRTWARSRAEATPHPSGYDFAPGPNRPPFVDALPAEPPALSNPDGGVTGDFVDRKQRSNSKIRRQQTRDNRSARGNLGIKKPG